MSNPVSNAEVEDVLASIRRLVSEEKRPAPVEVTEPVVQAAEASHDVVDADPVPHQTDETSPEPDITAEPAPAETGKLVLTPSLRVMEDDQSPAEPDAQTPDAPANADATDPWQMSETPSVTQLSEEESALDAAHYEAMQSAEADESLTQDPSDAAPADDAAETATSPATAPEHPVEQHAAAITEEARIDPTSLSAKIAALEAVIGKRSDHWEPDGVAETDAYSGTEAPSLQWEDHVPSETPEPAPDPAPTLEAEEYEDDIEDAPASEVDGLVAENTAEALLEEETILDEDTLRDLVADIVRQELQGALGERITRNVRKLVRREIQRALAAQDLE